MYFLSAISNGCFRTGIICAVLTLGQPFAGSAFFSMAWVVLAVAVGTVTSVAAHIPFMNVPYLCKVWDDFIPKLIAHAGKVDAHIAAVSALGVVCSLCGKWLPVGFLFYHNKLFDLFKLFGSGDVDDHPFSLVVIVLDIL